MAQRNTWRFAGLISGSGDWCCQYQLLISQAKSWTDTTPPISGRMRRSCRANCSAFRDLISCWNLKVETLGRSLPSPARWAMVLANLCALSSCFTNESDHAVKAESSIPFGDRCSSGTICQSVKKGSDNMTSSRFLQRFNIALCDAGKGCHFLARQTLLSVNLCHQRAYSPRFSCSSFNCSCSLLIHRSEEHTSEL